MKPAEAWEPVSAPPLTTVALAALADLPPEPVAQTKASLAPAAQLLHQAQDALAPGRRPEALHAAHEAPMPPMGRCSRCPAVKRRKVEAVVWVKLRILRIRQYEEGILVSRQWLKQSSTEIANSPAVFSALICKSHRTHGFAVQQVVATRAHEGGHAAPKFCR